MDLSIIKKLRKELNLSQQELGNKLGVSGSYIQQLETNKKNPSIKTLSKIAVALNIEPQMLRSLIDNNSTMVEEKISISQLNEINKLTLGNLPQLSQVDVDIDSNDNADDFITDKDFILDTSKYLSDRFEFMSIKSIEDMYISRIDDLTKIIEVYKERLITAQDKLIRCTEKLIDIYESDK